MNVDRARGLAESLAEPVVVAKSGEAALAQLEGVRNVAREILKALEEGSWRRNESVPMTYSELTAVLKDMAALVEVGDSFEGYIQYEMPPVPEWAERGEPKPEGWEDPEVLVRASYRIGNSMGQGGIRIIGTMGGRPRE